MFSASIFQINSVEHLGKQDFLFPPELGPHLRENGKLPPKLL